MNLGQVARMLSGFTLFFTLALLVPLGVAFGEDPEMGTRLPFLGAVGIGVVMASLLRFFGRNAPRDFFRRDSYS